MVISWTPFRLRCFPTASQLTIVYVTHTLHLPSYLPSFPSTQHGLDELLVASLCEFMQTVAAGGPSLLGLYSFQEIEAQFVGCIRFFAETAEVRAAVRPSPLQS